MRKYDNSDYMSRKMDEELERLEEILTALYANASNEVKAQFAEFMADFEPKNENMRMLVEQGFISEAEYQSWARLNLLQKKEYQAFIEALTKTLVSTDEEAMAIIRGDLPYVIGQSYNFVQSLGWKAADEAGYSVGTFQIYNADAVQKLIKDNPDLLPFVDLPLDQKWNKDRINNTITQGIIQGYDIPTVSSKLQQVAAMDESTAVRTARTSMTYAENLGRDESYQRLKEAGIPVHKEWSAVIDERTRVTHKMLNGTRANKDGLFGEGILKKLMRCPADPNGEPQEIYNCRCRLGVVFDDDVVDHSKDDELYEQFLKENYPESYEALLDRDYFNEHTSKPVIGKGKAKGQAAESKLIQGKESEVTKLADQAGITKTPIEPLEKPLDGLELIEKVGGGDMTKGSCVSAAYAYCGNEAGYDVEDFRGGASQELFSHNSVIRQIAGFDGVTSWIERNTNDFKACKAIFANMEVGKKYILTTGKHGALIQTDGVNYYYLELQSKTNNGWHELNSESLKYRFKCKRSHSSYGMKLETTTVLIDTESLEGSPEFIGVLQYINTSKPMKGAAGSEK